MLPKTQMITEDLSMAKIFGWQELPMMAFHKCWGQMMGAVEVIQKEAEDAEDAC